jgi:serine/threonine-protein kinase
MGTVYRAVDTRIGKDVAVKMLSPTPDGKPMTEQLKRRFLREVLAISRIKHPHVVGVHHYGFTEEGIPYMVMDLLEGQDLNKLLKQSSQPLATSHAVDIMMEVCSALRACHQVGVIHRDLKPANVFLTTSETGHGWEVKIIDFGVAKAAIAGELTEHGQIIGTWQYLSPEQVEGKAGPASDQYAIGVMLYQCLTRRLPYAAFKGTAVLKAIDRGEFVKPRELRPDTIPEGLEAIILRAMRLSPSDRFDSVYELGQHLWEHASPLGKELWKNFYFHSPVPRGLPRQLSAGIAISLVQDLTGGPSADEVGTSQAPTRLANYQGATAATSKSEAHLNSALLMATQPPTTPDSVLPNDGAGGTQIASKIAVDSSWREPADEEQSSAATPERKWLAAGRRHIIGIGVILGAALLATVGGLALRRSDERLIRPARSTSATVSVDTQPTGTPRAAEPLARAALGSQASSAPASDTTSAAAVSPVSRDKPAEGRIAAPNRVVPKKEHRARLRKALEMTPDGIPLLP